MRAYVLVAAICSLSAALDDAEVPADMFEEAASIFDEFPTVVYPSAESSKMLVFLCKINNTFFFFCLDIRP